MLPEFYGSTDEPLERLSYVAAATERIKLGTAVLVAPLHVPVMLARRLATLDRFSGGRVIAGLAGLAARRVRDGERVEQP